MVRDGKVVPELLDVFQLIKDHNAVLGTAHVSPEDAFIVVEAARKAGVEKVVVTHPEWWIVGMSVEDQIRLVKDYDVILERCFAQNMGGGKYKSNLPDNLEIIRTVGYKNVMTDTDGGQTENPNLGNRHGAVSAVSGGQRHSHGSDPLHEPHLALQAAGH